MARSYNRSYNLKIVPVTVYKLKFLLHHRCIDHPVFILFTLQTWLLVLQAILGKNTKNTQKVLATFSNYTSLIFTTLWLVSLCTEYHWKVRHYKMFRQSYRTIFWSMQGTQVNLIITVGYRTDTSMPWLLQACLVHRLGIPQYIASLFS